MCVSGCVNVHVYAMVRMGSSCMKIVRVNERVCLQVSEHNSKGVCACNIVN